MVRDPDAEVRRVVAARIDAEWLMPMAADDAGVRAGDRGTADTEPARVARGRSGLARALRGGRARRRCSSPHSDDPDPMVRERVQERFVVATTNASAVPPGVPPLPAGDAVSGLSEESTMTNISRDSPSSKLSAARSTPFFLTTLLTYGRGLAGRADSWTTRP